MKYNINCFVIHRSFSKQCRPRSDCVNAYGMFPKVHCSLCVYHYSIRPLFLPGLSNLRTVTVKYGVHLGKMSKTVNCNYKQYPVISSLLPLTHPHQDCTNYLKIERVIYEYSGAGIHYMVMEWKTFQ